MLEEFTGCSTVVTKGEKPKIKEVRCGERAQMGENKGRGEICGKLLAMLEQSDRWSTTRARPQHEQRQARNHQNRKFLINDGEDSKLLSMTTESLYYGKKTFLGHILQ